tara:strand:- start:2601 stop:2912 length:312 start_codon:yes stop_codon:yes gene_type:complete
LIFWGHEGSSNALVRVFTHKHAFYFQNGPFWLTQKAMAELFWVKVPAINKHLKNILETGELDQAAVISTMETTAADGKAHMELLPCIMQPRISLKYRPLVNGT